MKRSRLRHRRALRMNPRGIRRRNPVELVVVNPGTPGALRKARKKHSTKSKKPKGKKHMARRIRRRRNPRVLRNSKGRFMKARSNPAPKRRRRRVKHVANPSPIRRRRRRARANPSPIRRRRRRLRRNPLMNPAPKRRRRLRRNPAKKAKHAKKSAKKSHAKKAKGSHKRKRRQKRRSKSLAMVRKLYKRARKYKRRSLARSVAMAQYHRASALRRLSRRRPAAASRSPLAKAMHIKANPGFAGVVAAAKVIAPQAAVGAGAMFGIGFAGKLAADKVREMAGASIPAGLQPYVPAISTALLTGVGYVVADKVAPKFKGAVAIGGLMGAIVQAVVAASASAPDSFLGKAKSALLGDYTLVGDYTTVGGRAYAEAGIFREVGDYTTVGQGMDNSTEWARDSLRGLDDNTEFAPGEGGVLSGGLFRGPTSR